MSFLTIDPLSYFSGYTVFAEDLPKSADGDGDPFTDLPEGLTLTLQNNCFSAGARIVCPLVPTTDPGLAPNKGPSGLVVRLGGSTGDSVIVSVNHWAHQGDKMYLYQEWPVSSNWDAGSVTVEDINTALLTGNNTIEVQIYVPSRGFPEEDNLALAHVHGIHNGQRIRYGTSARDYNVYTVNALSPSISSGDSLYYKQYFVMDRYTEMANRLPQWAAETETGVVAQGTVTGRTINLYSDGSSTFGHTFEDRECGENSFVCEGNTTPQDNTTALFQVRCGSSLAVTNDLYVFTPTGSPVRSYVCDGMSDVRPVWILLGFFDIGACAGIATGYELDEGLC